MDYNGVTDQRLFDVSVSTLNNNNNNNNNSNSIGHIITFRFTLFIYLM